ncbi:hypothetical protein SD51_03580 [Alicyclobacillus tengchongensis]|nr:hypothetical protein SD51_03580 [Alicyclobacillus tengchongensis]
MHFQEIIHQYGYFGVFLIILVEAIGFPFPAETTLTLSGIEWSKGVFHLVPLWLAGCLGNLIGSAIAYLIGWYLGRPIVLFFGKFIGITPAKLDAANERFQRYELWVVFIAKFIAGVRILIPYLAGINRMKPWLFFVFNTIAAIVWSGLFIIAGRYIGEFVTKYWPFFKHHIVLLIVVVILLIALFVWFRIWEHRRSKGSKHDDTN